MINRLESLELQGFKTFATITRLEFPGQITAIVGPNGSGKSNIADSIRWVLGEQSYSLLRAKKTEDMIFSGSQQRSRAGMASSTITFNNEDGWLPIDYSEVSVSRRAYRDGQNEYLLNGQKVRLKDISEMLSQTGLSERTYTVIGQGLVDVALALKPDERRKLFEEAAGIGLYRSRKEESLRRLENTRKNLDRVLDIMTEIKPRLRSLERQATRFEQYQRLRDDLEVLLREWYGFHWHQKQTDLRNIRNDYRDQEKRLSTLRLKYSEVETKVEEAREARQSNRKSLESAHSELSENHREFERVTRELAIIDERQRSFNHQKSNLEIDIANVQQEITELEAQKQSYQAEIDSRLSDYEAAADEVNQADIQLSNVVVKKEKNEADLGAIRKKRIALETERVQVSARLEELANRVDSLVKEKTKYEQSIDRLEKEKNNITKTVGSLENAFEESQQAYSDLQEKITQKSDQLGKARSKAQGIDQTLTQQETRQAKLQAQLNVLNQAEAALSGYSEGSKTVVADSRKGRLPAGIEPLSKHLIVDEKFERAISAALGELADLLVVPSKGKNLVIEYLESRNSDRVALVPMDHGGGKPGKNSFTQEKDVYGFANQLIKVDEPYQNLVDRLFSDILIVKDQGSAQKVQPHLTGTQKAVTLGGLVFQANGILISGQTASGKRMGRTRQQSEMQQTLVEIKDEISKLEKQKNANAESVKQLQVEHDELIESLKVADKEQREARQNHQEALDSKTRVQEQLGWNNERLHDIQENIKETLLLIKSGESKLGAFDERVNALLDDEKTYQTELRGLPLFELQQALNHWQTHRIVTKNALETAKQRFQDLQNRIREAHQRLETYQSRLTDLEQGLVDIHERETSLKAAAEKVANAIETIKSTRIEPLTTTGESAEKTVSALQKLETHSHKQVIIAERHFTQLQLELSRREDQLNNLRERIEDDFGLVSYDYEQKFDGPAPLPFTDGLIEKLPRVQTVPDNLEDEIKRLKSQIRRIGAINPEAQQEYIDVKERFEFLTAQIDDLEKASKDLKAVIEELDTLMARDFIRTFKAVDQEFSIYFSRLFNGGEAKLMFLDEENPVEGGVDIEARLPGRRRQGLALLSGGERSLTAVALIFALLKVSPTPFCILDEVDAMLDESNVGRFIELLRELSKNTQFVIITHNRNTVQAADVIYGVTMGRDSTSQMISLKLEDVDETYLE